MTPSAERDARYEKLREAMDRAGLEALVVCGRTDAPGRLQYLTNVPMWMGHNYCVLFPGRDPVCIVDPVNVHGVDAFLAAGWVSDGFQAADDAQAVSDVLRMGGSLRSVGIVGRGDMLSVSMLESLQQHLPSTSLTDATAAFDGVRKV